jgi:FlaG/FlaF family flagellin (archaellin)
MKFMIKKDEAVSPVVGVMLMLVVTIIIAAVVSGFAGGLAGETSKSAQVSIKADYSQSTGMTISHMGGDVINTLNTKIFVAPTADFGSYEQLRWEVNTSVVTMQKGRTQTSSAPEPYKNEDLWPWFNPTLTASYNARTFQPGETAMVSVADLGQVQPKTYTTGTDDSKSSYYGFNYTTDSRVIGQRFILSLVDDAGRTIAQTEVQIKS